MKRLDNSAWLKIKTDYEFGDKSIRKIAAENGITDAAIRSRITKEGWTQKVRTQVIEIQRNIAEITQQSTREQLPYIQNKLNEVLDLQKKIKSFIATAIDVNLKNIAAVNSEPDDLTRMKMTALMKANMSDLANVYPATVKEADKEDKQEDTVINLIME